MGVFNSKQLAFFNASIGAGSIVTEREEFDSQITIDTNEKVVLHSHIPQSIISRMSIKKTSSISSFSFIEFSTRKNVSLNLNLPKSKGNETRLYLSESSGFKPRAGDYWFLFEKINTKNLIIGSVDDGVWSASGGVKSRSSSRGSAPKIYKPPPQSTDDEDHIYQGEIYSSTPAPTKTGTYKREHRDRAVAITSLKNASYKCELTPLHKTFMLESGSPYIEAHHLIPISKQTELRINLDIPENIVALCPNCHRAVHHAEKVTRLAILDKLYLSRKTQLLSAGINHSLSDLARMYNCI